MGMTPEEPTEGVTSPRGPTPHGADRARVIPDQVHLASACWKCIPTGARPLRTSDNLPRCSSQGGGSVITMSVMSLAPSLIEEEALGRTQRGTAELH